MKTKKTIRVVGVALALAALAGCVVAGPGYGPPPRGGRPGAPVGPPPGRPVPPPPAPGVIIVP